PSATVPPEPPGPWPPEPPAGKSPPPEPPGSAESAQPWAPRASPAMQVRATRKRRMGPPGPLAIVTRESPAVRNCGPSPGSTRLPHAGVAPLAAVRGRGGTLEAFEGAVEGGLAAVTHAVGDVRKRQRSLGQQLRGPQH